MSLHIDVGAADVDGLVGIYDAAVGPVHRYLMRGCCGRRPLAEDLTQETFLVAAQAFREGRSETVTLPWLLGVAATSSSTTTAERNGRTGRGRMSSRAPDSRSTRPVTML